MHGVTKVPAKRAPELGEHNEEILEELGFDAKEIERLSHERHAWQTKGTGEGNIGLSSGYDQNMNYSKTKLTMPVLAVGATKPVACRMEMKISNTNRNVKFCLVLKENTSYTE